jgi:hypothetical protein
VPATAAVVALAWPYYASAAWLASRGGKGLVVATFATAAFGALVGGAACLAVRWGRCRHPRVGFAVGALLGIVAVAASHVASFRHAAAGADDLTVWEYLEACLAVGWRVDRWGATADISGQFVYWVWAAELVAVAWIAALCGRAAARCPFCEACGAWAGKELARGKRPCPGDGDADAVKRASDLDSLLGPSGPAPSGGAPARQHVEYVVRGCPKCGGFSTISADHTALEPYVKGGERELRQALRKDLMLNGQDSRRAVAAVTAMAAGAARA